jgi:hypothetical protein
VAKDVTREQAQRKKTQAAAFLERIGQPDRAEEFNSMSVDEYADHKRLRLTNPKRRRTTMATGNGTTTKADLQDTIDQAISVLDDAYQPETTREDLAEAVGNALEILRGDEEEDEDEGDNGDDLDDDYDNSQG